MGKKTVASGHIRRIMTWVTDYYEKILQVTEIKLPAKTV